jgi:hypothetical protein
MRKGYFQILVVLADCIYDLVLRDQAMTQEAMELRKCRRSLLDLLL